MQFQHPPLGWPLIQIKWSTRSISLVHSLHPSRTRKAEAFGVDVRSSQWYLRSFPSPSWLVPPQVEIRLGYHPKGRVVGVGAEELLGIHSLMAISARPHAPDHLGQSAASLPYPPPKTLFNSNMLELKLFICTGSLKCALWLSIMKFT